MKKKVLIWKESVYKNGFRCTKCGKPLMVDGKLILNRVMIENGGFRKYVYCKHCFLPVAYEKVMEMPEEEHGMMGDINEYERKKLN